jgi:hypothetical protein
LHAATGALSDADASDIAEIFVRGQGDQGAAQILKLAGLSKEIIKEAMLSPRAFEYNRGAALGTISLPEFLRGPPRLLLREMLRAGAFGGSYSAEQEELVWRVMSDGLELYASNKIGVLEATQFGLCWKGITGPLGWGAVSPKLPPNVRGPVAYVFGKRMLQTQNQQAARVFLQAALANSEADSTLRRLAQSELERLDKK